MAVTKKSFHGKAGLGLGPELYADGDMEAAGTGSWVPVGVTLTKESGRALAGNQVLRLTKSRIDWGGARQAIVTMGKAYCVTGWCRGDGTAIPRFGGGSYYWYGTNSTDWQWADFIAVADSPNLYCYLYGGDIGNWVEFDDISVREVLHPQIEWKTDYGPATTGSLTSGFIGETPWRIVSGTWDIDTASINNKTTKVLRCTAAGDAYLPSSAMGISPSEAAYGTWEFPYYFVSSGSSYTWVICDDRTNPQNGYAFLSYNGSATLYRYTAGNPSAIISQAQGTYSTSAYHTVKITRSDAGAWALYIDGSSAGSISSATHTTSDCIYLDWSATARLGLGDTAGDRAFCKYKGVI